MKKYIQNIWVRFLACLLCVIALLGLTAGAAGTFYFAEEPEKDRVLESGYEKIMQSYALYGVNYLHLLEKEGYLENTNLYMKIEKLEYLSDTVEEPVVTKSFSNMPVGVVATYELEDIYASSEKWYSTKSLLQALNSGYQTSTSDLMVPTPIDGYAFDVNTGLFYYHTAVGYFKVDYLYVSHNGVSYDYNLTVRNGEEVYYNSYYGKTLDPTEYQEWEWVRIADKKMGITEAYLGSNVHIISDSTTIQEQLCTMNYYVNSYHVYYVSDKVTSYRVQMALAQPLEKKDLFLEYKTLVDKLYQLENHVPMVLCFSLLGIVIGLVLLTVSAPEEKEKLRFFHKIPIVLFTGMVGLVEVGVVCLIGVYNELFIYQERWPITVQGYVIPMLLIASMFLLVFFVYVGNVITRIKTKSIFRYSEFYYLSRPIIFLCNTAREHMSIFWKGVLGLLVISLVEAFVLIMNQHSIGAIMGWFLLGKGIELVVILYILIQMKALKEGAKRVATGDFIHPIDTSRMVGDFKEHAEDINQVSDGIAIAVEEQMKSERFKTELITNVSHDIKTPLTSIINYVDLIKKENIEDATVQEYVEVLDRQSARLKKLIEDLMEASKASTGNLEVHLEECDLGVLLTQVAGEFQEKLQASGLEVVVQKPEEALMILADGRHIWRVLDNLMNNICKYSQENTRVYVSLEQVGNEAQVVFKNISKGALNIPSDQLLQRFVRGDSSRHTEGSGLGLSIAQSLTELMNGQMKLDIDGDLFKVTLKFNTTA